MPALRASHFPLFTNEKARNTRDILLANFCFQHFIDQPLKIAALGLSLEGSHHAGIKRRVDLALAFPHCFAGAIQHRQRRLFVRDFWNLRQFDIFIPPCGKADPATRVGFGKNLLLMFGGPSH